MLILLATLMMMSPAYADDEPHMRGRGASVVAAPPPRARTVPRPRAAALERLEVEVWVVEGREAPGPIDPQLEPLSRELRSHGLRSFELLARTQTRVTDGEVVLVPFADRRIEVQLLERTHEQAKIHVSLMRPGEPQPTQFVTWIPRGQALLVGGPKTATGRLLYPVTVR